MGFISMGKKSVNSIIPRPKKGIYISLEGIEGVGKTFYQDYIVKRALKDSELVSEVVPSIEVSKNGFGKEVTDVLGKHDDEFFRVGYPISESLVFFSMKLFELIRTITPALEKNKIVVEDRSIDTNSVYAAVQIAQKYKISEKNAFLQLLKVRKLLAFIPDKTILLLDDFHYCIDRARNRIGRKLAKSEINFISKVLGLYIELPIIIPNRILSIDLTEIPLEDRKEVVWSTFKRICILR